MNKIAAIALSISLVSSAAFAQATPPAGPPVVPGNPPTVLIAGGIGTGGIVLGALGLLLLTGLGGRNPNNDDGGGSSSSSSSSN